MAATEPPIRLRHCERSEAISGLILRKNLNVCFYQKRTHDVIRNGREAEESCRKEFQDFGYNSNCLLV
jgi:hypothetical protein